MEGEFLAYADGSAIGMLGGWAFSIKLADGSYTEQSGFDPNTTNNRMELTGVIRALEALPDDAKGVLLLDSKYVVKGLAEWRYAWEKNGWKTSGRKPVANQDLWSILIEVRDQKPNVRVEWIKGHTNEAGNERVDVLARLAAMSGGRIDNSRIPIMV